MIRSTIAGSHALPYDIRPMTASDSRRHVNSPRRANFFTAGLLIAVLGAAYLNSRGEGPPSLATPIAPRGWRLSFAPPDGWTDDGEVLDSRGMRSRRFTGVGDRELIIGRTTVDGDTKVESFCLEMFGEADAQLVLIGARDIRLTETQVGAWPAALLDWTPEFMGQAIGQHLFMLGTISGEDASGKREGYVVKMRSPVPVSKRDQRIWDLIVDSVSIEADGS